MRRVKAILILIVNLFALALAVPSQGAEIDQAFILDVLKKSQCQVPDSFASDFAAAIDRLSGINRLLADHIRSVSYRAKLNLVCDLPDDSNGIYYVPTEQTIHLREGAGIDWKTPASFFHEFLHFAGVRIDLAYHAAPKMENVVEVDNVYACHVAVFPKILEYPKLGSSRLGAAISRCAQADFE